jgi:hypothetical protein
MNTDYDSYEIKLANEIAETLKDRDALPLFLQYTRTFQEGYLRKTLARVMSIPESKIRKSRGALFTFLIQQNGNNHDGARGQR